MRHVTFVFLVALPLIARAAPPDDLWFTVLLDGRKIGSFETTRAVSHDSALARVSTMQKLDIALERAGVKIALGTEETSVESVDGEPLAFTSITRLSGTDTRIDGTIHDGRIDVTIQSGGGAPKSRQIAWPEGALLPEGLRLAGVKAGLEAGTHYRALAFQPSSLDAVAVDTTVGTTRTLDLPSGSASLTGIVQTLDFSGAAATSRAWVDADQTVHKLVMPMAGVDLTLLACDRACATAPNQDTDMFARMLIEAPRALGVAERTHGLRYTLAPRDDGPALDLPDTDEQRVVRDGRNLVVSVSGHPVPGAQAPPAAIDYQDTDWLQSRAPDIIALAQRGAGDATTPLARMQRLQTFVRGYIKDKSLDVGYASALEVAHKPEGDCTEHAVLLAALGRALGIATHVVDGLAYTADFAGADRVFVPHAWVQAWVDGRWQSFDAALPGFDTGHIALSVGDGDPWRFYAGLGALGRMDLRSIDTLEPAAAPATHALMKNRAGPHDP